MAVGNGLAPMPTNKPRGPRRQKAKPVAAAIAPSGLKAWHCFAFLVVIAILWHYFRPLLTSSEWRPDFSGASTGCAIVFQERGTSCWSSSGSCCAAASEGAKAMRSLWASVHPGENTGRASCCPRQTAARHQCRTRGSTATVEIIASTSSPRPGPSCLLTPSSFSADYRSLNSSRSATLASIFLARSKSGGT